jgi:hypothetical protein
MKQKRVLGALLFIVATTIAVSGPQGPLWSVALALVGIGAGSLLIPGFWRSLIYGAIGGAVAGLLVLGPGLRIAMRVVAVVDPLRTPEFTVGGTMVIVIFVGGVVGTTFGVFGNILRVGFSIPSRVAGLLPALLVMLMIGIDGELRGEIVELGAGPWINIPMFGVVAVGYGGVWARVVTQAEKRRVEKMERHSEVVDATMTLSDPKGLTI